MGFKIGRRPGEIAWATICRIRFPAFMDWCNRGISMDRFRLKWSAEFEVYFLTIR
jgi:hypothetical protein